MGGFLFGGAYWTRTSDPIDVNDVLYQLSQSTGNKKYYSTEDGNCQPEIYNFSENECVQSLDFSTLTW